MPRYQVTTLIDITRTDVTRSATDQLKIGQQANFNSLIQAINLRSNVTWLRAPLKQEGLLPEPFDGKATYWTWEFDVERDDVFLFESDPVGHLANDINNVPVIDCLENTATIDPAAFRTKGTNINTVFAIVS